MGRAPPHRSVSGPARAPGTNGIGHTYTRLLYHGVFSTKERGRLLDAEVLPEMEKVIAGIISDKGSGAAVPHVRAGTLYVKPDASVMADKFTGGALRTRSLIAQ